MQTPADGIAGLDSCGGDSGGPLVVPVQDFYVQVGVVSWGTGTPTCGDPQYPGVYARVAGHLAWIVSNVPDALVGTGPMPPAPPLHPPPPPPPPLPPGCMCSDVGTGCLSNGRDVSARCGCGNHVSDGTPFCYIVDSGNCPAALASGWVIGTAWRPCEALTPSSPPSSSAHLEPPPLLPPPPAAFRPWPRSVALRALRSCARCRRLALMRLAVDDAAAGLRAATLPSPPTSPAVLPTGVTVDGPALDELAAVGRFFGDELLL